MEGKKLGFFWGGLLLEAGLLDRRVYSLFFHYPLNVSNVISGAAAAASKSNFYTGHLLFHDLLNSTLQNLERYLTSVYNRLNRLLY